MMWTVFGNAIGTNVAPPYACIFMGKNETDFLKTLKTF